MCPIHLRFFFPFLKATFKKEGIYNPNVGLPKTLYDHSLCVFATRALNRQIIQNRVIQFYPLQVLMVTAIIIFSVLFCCCSIRSPGINRTPKKKNQRERVMGLTAFICYGQNHHVNTVNWSVQQQSKTQID